MYLIDTNIWLERLLAQEKSDVVGQFLAITSASEMVMTDFTLHSIGVILARLGKQGVFPQFVDDLFISGGVALVQAPLAATHRLVRVMDEFKLDFDDAYQYVVAERINAEIVSFDSDFDKTERGRQTPEMLMAGKL